MSRPPWLPYATPDESELPGRPGYEVTQESRFDVDPDAQHLPSCACTKCIDAQRCEKCGKRGGLIDCEMCRVLNRAPRARGPNPYRDDDGTENHIPIRGEGYLGPLRWNGQRVGDSVRTKPTCATCGCTEREKLWLVRDQYECLHHLKAECVARVAASRLRLVKVEQP